NDNSEVVGLLTFRGDTVNGQEVSGFSFVVASNTVMEYVKSAGASNEMGPTDKLYREGLEAYWNQHYSEAIPKFEEVKRLFPQHSEVERLLQSSQQAKSEGRDRSSFPVWIVAVVVIVVILIGAILLIGLIVFLVSRRKKKAAPAATPAGGKDHRAPAPASYSPSPANYSPSPNRSPTPSPAVSNRPSPAVAAAADQGMTIDLSRTVAIGSDTSPINYGSIRFVSGTLAGQQFEVKPDGEYLGRDSSSAQIVISDPRISKRHLWIGVREGRVLIVDQGSRNGTFI